MTSKIANLVQQTTTGTGTGNLTLSTINGKQSFDTAFGHAATTDVFYYFISNRDAAEWEFGTGHMSDATTLVRDTVIASTNTNAAVSFSAGTKDVVNDLPQSVQTMLETIGGVTSGLALYASSGSVGGATNLKIDAAGNANLGVYTTTDPSAPSTGTTLFSRSRCGKTDLAAINTTNRWVDFQPNLGACRTTIWRATGFSSTAFSQVAGGIASAAGTATAKTWANTNLATSMFAAVSYVSSASSGSTAGVAGAATAGAWRGNASGLGGFDYRCRFIINTVQTNMRWFVGMTAGNTSGIGNNDPSGLVNMLGFGIDSGQTTVRFLTNDGSGACTATDLGANFPATTANVIYEARLYCKPNDTVVYYSLERFDSVQFTEGSASSNLISNTIQIFPQFSVNNGSTAAAVAMDLVSMYLTQDS